MSTSLTNSRVERLQKRLDSSNQTQAKAEVNKVDATAEHLGLAIDTAISLAGRTQKETWAAMGHNDGARLSQWIAGARNPSLADLWRVAWLRQPLVIALAKAEGVEVETTIRIRRSA